MTPFLSRLWDSFAVQTDRQVPHPVVLVGHVEDPLAMDCPHLGVEVCRTFFVVDRFAWVDGELLGPRVPPDEASTTVPRTRRAADISLLVRRQFAADGTVQSMTVLEARSIANIDPTVDLQIDGRAVIWYVRAVETGTNRIGSFIVDDATGELLWSAFPMWLPTPPSAVP